MGVVASILSVLASLAAFEPESGSGRVVVLENDGTEMRACIRTVERAVNNEDLDAYVECFVVGIRSPLRHRIGMLFVKHEMEMEILDIHVLGVSEKGGEVAVKYRAVLSGRASEVVAVLHMKQEDGRWRIDKETVHSNQGQPAKTVNCGSTCGMQQFHFGGGQVAGGVPLNWNPFDPPAHLIDPELEHLRGDIGIMPGRGCSSGRCGQVRPVCR